MVSYPIDYAVLRALGRFRTIDATLDWRREHDQIVESPLEIFRLLGNAHYPGIELCLKFLNRTLRSAGKIGMQLLREKDPVRFSQRLAELYLLDCSWVMGQPRIKARASSARHDIDIRVGALRARVEVYSPIDHYGYRFVEWYVPPLFRYSPCDRGFDVRVELEVHNNNGFYPHDIDNSDRVLRPWLGQLKQDVHAWMKTAGEGSTRLFEGVDETFKIKATLKSVVHYPKDRNVWVKEPSRSTDTRLFFEQLQPIQTARSQIGRKIGCKMKRRQCGEASPDYLRVLVVDFSLTDSFEFSWFWWPRLTERIDKTIKILAEQIGDPLPYDVVLPACLDVHCCFGKATVLDPSRKAEVAQLVKAAGFGLRCKPPLVLPPPPKIKKLLDRMVADESAANYASTESESAV